MVRMALNLIKIQEINANLLKQNIIVDYIPRKLDISTTNIINKIILNYSNEKK